MSNREAQAHPGRSAFDEYQLNELFGFIHTRMKDCAQVAYHLEAGLKSGFLSEKEVPARVRSLAQANYLSRNYGRAIQYARQSLATNATDESMTMVVWRSPITASASTPTQQVGEDAAGQRSRHR